MPKFLASVVLMLLAASWSTAVPERIRDAAANVTTIYLVSSCHLDVGFADTAANIVNEYFDRYFPEAIEFANILRKLGVEERLVFTTHPYLVYLYMNCHPELGLHCPSNAQLQNFTDAVKRGDIVWHAFPFNAEMEFYDRFMADFGFKVTHALDEYYGKEPTITMSQRDVPGTTRSIIPIMNANGVKAITVGVNTASMPPAVPSAFVWKDPVSGTDIIGMWHPHGYGGQKGPGLDSMVIVPGLQQALAFAIRGDNSGPPSVLEVIGNYATLKNLFPRAKIIASGYDAFVNDLLQVKSQLPVYSEEIGDTWIHGVASDPWKTAQAREIMRLSAKCLADKECSIGESRFDLFSQMLIKNGEHTWGKDVKKYLHDTTHWTNTQFHSSENSSNFQDMVKSWVEQRFWGLDFAIELLKDHPLRSTIEQSLKMMRFDGNISLSGYTKLSDLSAILNCGDFELKFSSQNGAITHFIDKRSSTPVVYADDEHPLAQIVYQTFTNEDYKDFLDEYVYDFSQGYIFLDLGKPGLPNDTEKMTISPQPKSLWYRENASAYSFLLEQHFEDKVVTDYGGSQAVWTQVTIPKSGQASELNLTVYFVNKTSTRIPESISLLFNPIVRDTSSMLISKLGEDISVLDVIKNGSKHLHASDLGVSYSGGLRFTSWDTSLICIGRPNPFPVPMEQPDVSQGFSFSFYDNIWGTNYIMWYPYLTEDASSKYRFRMTLPKD